MVELAIVFGIFSYAVFGLGLLSLLGNFQIKIISFLFLVTLIFLAYKNSRILKIKFYKLIYELKKDRLNCCLIVILIIAVLVNLIGALGPELAFDSLWYHLTLPKLYLREERIFFVPGGLFYYSAMPKLTEMVYLASLVFSPSGTGAKLIHFIFGLLSVLALFNLSNRYLKFRAALMVTVLFYTSLIVGWESITAYVDLARTFFEILALDLFLRWWEKSKKIFLVESSLMLGLAIATKLLAFASLPIYLILIFVKSKKPLSAIGYLLSAVFVTAPWLVFSFVSAKNPVYPIFSGILDSNHNLPSFNPISLIKDLWQLFYRPADPASPLFLLFLPFIPCFYLKKKSKKLRVLFWYFLLALLFWSATPRTGGYRFFLPYLPSLSLLVVYVVYIIDKFYQKIFLFLLFFCSLTNIGYRALANYKYWPVVLGKATKDDFLMTYLNFAGNDFYDPGGEIKKIVQDDLVLIYGSHNLFYADFNFRHESFAQNAVSYSYVLTQNQHLAEKYGGLNLLYDNPATKIKLYLYGGSLK